jgi:hypothetical protein
LTAAKAVPLVFGVAAHNAVENYIRGDKKESLFKHWESAWEATVEASGEIAWGNKSFDSESVVGERIFTNQKIINMVNGIAPMEDNNYKYIEHFFEFVIPGIRVPFVGYVDIIGEDGIICDFKTSSKRWPTGNEKMELQPLLYLAGMARTGARNFVATDKFRYYIFVKQTGEPQHILMEDITKERIEWAVEQVRQVWKGIRAESFPVTSKFGWWCNPSYCEYWDACGRTG